MGSATRKRAGTRKTRTRTPHWASWSDAELLELRMCDLGLRVEGTPLAARVERLHSELESRGLRFKPHVWLSTEWFSPDGVPGIAMPFFLAHPRLTRLEARQMLEVDGGTAASCMRILRHEAGHAIDTAFRLHFRKRWREVFGPFSQRYPQYYRPRPNSRSYVLHLDAWYAQAHPAEDFAETFAVWLTPRSNWRQAYRNWPTALAKLRYVDELMTEIDGRQPKVRSRARIESLPELRTTLEQHYRRKRRRYGAAWPDYYDADLRRLFSDERRYESRPRASVFLRAIRPEIRSEVAGWTGAHSYTVNQVLQDMIERCRELKLRLAVPREEARRQATLMLTVHTMNCLHGRRHEIAL